RHHQGQRVKPVHRGDLRVRQAGRTQPAGPLTSPSGVLDGRRLAPRVARRCFARRPGATRGASRLLSTAGRVGDSLRESHPGASPGAPERVAERVAYFLDELNGPDATE